MQLSRKRRQTAGIFLILSFILIIILLFVQLSNYFSINPFFPPSPKTEMPITLTYPPNANGELQPIWLRVHFIIEANGTISEGINLTLTNVTGATYRITNSQKGININNVWIGFNYAEPWNAFTWSNTPDVIQDNFITSPNGVWLVSTENEKMEPFIQNVFNFPVAGDYSPSIIVENWNATTNNSTFYEYTYNEIKLHVAPASEIRLHALNQIGGIISIVLLIFGFIESVKMVHEWVENAPKNNENQEDISIGDDI